MKDEEKIIALTYQPADGEVEYLPVHARVQIHGVEAIDITDDLSEETHKLLENRTPAGLPSDQVIKLRIK